MTLMTHCIFTKNAILLFAETFPTFAFSARLFKLQPLRKRYVNCEIPPKGK